MRAYLINGDDDDYGCVVFVAETAQDAKRLAVGHDVLANCEYIDIRVNWCKDVDVSGLPEGEIDIFEGLKRGAYEYVYGVPCPKCGADEPELRIYKEFCERCESGADIGEHRII